MNKIPALGCAFLLFLAGCCFGDRVAASRTVSLHFPASENQSKVSFSANDTQVQEALNLIDRVLSTRGFVREASRADMKEQGLVSSYAKFSGTGLRAAGGPSVYVEGDRLRIVVVEGGNRNEPLSRMSKQLCELLRSELSGRYGSKRVKVER